MNFVSVLIIALLVIAILFGIIVMALKFNPKDTLTKFLEQKNIKLSRKNKKYIDSLKDDDKKKIMAIVNAGHDIMVGLEDNEFDNSIKILDVDTIEFDKFFACFKMIHVADPTFTLANMLAVYNAIEKPNEKKKDKEADGDNPAPKKKAEPVPEKPKEPQKNTLESFARSWCDQFNANLEIDVDTALEFIHKNRDFANFVNLDIMAKRAEIDIDEKRLINDINEEDGLKVIIYSLIRAKYEGIYLSDEDSLKINKANVLEYNDTFKITQTLLMDLYNLKRDVNRFTNVMIRAHNSGIRINFSVADLYSLTDNEFDILVTNIIRASDSGINIDQKDLIRQNIQGNDISSLISGLIKANQANLDVTPDELMNYFVNTRGDVVKFVDALIYVKKFKLDATKDYLVSISKPNINLLDFVKALKVAKDYEGKENNYGITVESVKTHFNKFGEVYEAVHTVIKCREELNLLMNFGIAGKIMDGASIPEMEKDINPDEPVDRKDALKLAIAWAQNPQVLEVSPCVTCICKNGVQLTPKVNVTVRGKMEQIFWGYKLDVLFKRINEAIISEFSASESHEHILNTLPQISRNVLNRINEEENNKEIKTSELSETELNKHCSYNLLDVNIYDVVVGQNVKAELELRQAQIDSELRKLKAEADRAKAEADIRIAMVQQYKDGIKPNFNELHKANIMAELAQTTDISTGYEKPE